MGMKEMNSRCYQDAERLARERYGKSYSRSYRASDEDALNNATYRRLCEILGEACARFPIPISILELGCGTGRYFRCLRNAEYLLGIDISQDMLDQAAQPISANEITVSKIDLRRESLLSMACVEREFELIYAFGVLGEHTPFDRHVIDAVYGLLKPGGQFIFTIANAERRKKSWRRQCAENLAKLIPLTVLPGVARRLQSHYLSRYELDVFLAKSKFNNVIVDGLISDSSLWSGGHFICVASK